MAFDLDSYADNRPQPLRRGSSLDRWSEERSRDEDPGTLGGIWNSVKRGYYSGRRASALSDARDIQEEAPPPLEPLDASEAEMERRVVQGGDAKDEAELQRLSRRSLAKSNAELEVNRRAAYEVEKAKRIDDRSQRVAELTDKLGTLPSSEAYRRWQTSDGANAAWDAFASNPFQVTANMIGEGASQMAGQMAATAAAGAAGGSVFGPVGSTVGGGLGAGISAFRSEYANGFLQSMEEAGIDLSDKKSVISGLNDAKVMDHARTYAERRAIPQSIFNAVSAGLAGRFIAKPVAGAFMDRFAARTANGAIEAGIQSAVGAAGEAAAQYASTGKVDDLKSLVGAGIASFGMAPIEGIAAGAYRRIGSPEHGSSTVRITDVAAKAAEEAAGERAAADSPALAGERARVEQEARIRREAEGDFGEAVPAYARKKKAAASAEPPPPAPDPTGGPEGQGPFEQLQTYRIDGTLSTFVEHQQTGTVSAGVEFVRNAEDAANVLASLRRYPQENIVMLVTDKNGRPIHVARHQIGGPTSAGFNPGILIGTAASTPGAAEVWFAHNHPSGKASLSPADISASGAVQRLSEAAGLKYGGALAIAFDKFAFMDNGGSIYANRPVPDLPEKFKYPVTERVYRNVGYLGQTAFSDPLVVSQEMPGLLGGRPGIVLTNNANMPVAAIPLTEEFMRQMIRPGGADQFFASVERSNAVNAFVYTADMPPEARVPVIENISRLANASKITLLDAVDAAGVTHSRHIIGYDSSFRSRGEPGSSAGATEVGASVDDLTGALRSSFGKATDKLLELGRIRVVQSVDELPGVHPDDTKGVAMPDGTVHMVADNVGVDEARGMVLHEVGVHVGLENMLGSDLYANVLDHVDRLIASGDEHAVAAQGAVPDDTPAQMRREEQLAYLIQNAPESSVVRRIIAAVRAWVYRNVPGGRMMSLDIADLQELAKAAVRREANEAAGEGAADSSPALSRRGRTWLKTPDGGYDWGRLPEQDAKRLGVDPGRIVMMDGVHVSDHRGQGLEHIEAQHGDEIRELGQEPTDFVRGILRDYNNMVVQDGGRIALLRTSRPMAVAILDPMESGGYFVRTAYSDPTNSLYRRLSQRGDMVRRVSTPEPPDNVDDPGRGSRPRPPAPPGPPGDSVPAPKYSRSGGPAPRPTGASLADAVVSSGGKDAPSASALDALGHQDLTAYADRLLVGSQAHPEGSPERAAILEAHNAARLLMEDRQTRGGLPIPSSDETGTIAPHPDQETEAALAAIESLPPADPTDREARPSGGAEGHTVDGGSLLERLVSGPIKFLREFRSNLPELPDDIKFNRVREGYLSLKRGTEVVLKESQDRVREVLGPILDSGAGDIRPDLLAKLQDAQSDRRALLAAEQPDEAKVAKVEARVQELTDKLKDDPYFIFSNLVLYRDLAQRLATLRTKDGGDITLPDRLTREDVSGRLRFWKDQMASSPWRDQISESLRRHGDLVESTWQGLRDRGLPLEGQWTGGRLYFPHLVLDFWKGRMDNVAITAGKDFRKYLITPEGSPAFIETDYAKAMFQHLVATGTDNLHQDTVGAFFKPYDILPKLREEAAERTAESGRSVGWRALIPDGYVVYRPQAEGSIGYFEGLAIDRNELARQLGVALGEGPINAELRKAGVMGATITPELIKEALIKAEEEPWVLPKEVAQALDGMARRATENRPNVFSIPTAIWKKWTLFAPHNYIRYEFNNTTADLEKILSIDPKMATYLPRALSEVRAFMSGEKDVAPEAAAAFRMGVFDAPTAREAGELLESAGLDELLTGPGKVKAWMEEHATTRLSKLREATFRYAKFLADLDRLKAGERPVYGGAFWRDIDAMTESMPGAGDTLERKAAAVSLGTFGDYNAVTTSGDWLRKYWIPFYTYLENNFRYHANLFRNMRDMAIEGGDDPALANVEAAAKAGTSFTAKAALGVALRLALPWVAVQIWNSAGPGNEGVEDDISDEDRRRFHVNLGRDEKGRAKVMYLATGMADLLRWFAGNRFAQTGMDLMEGRTDWATAVGDFAKGYGDDLVNQVVSVGPAQKTIYTLASGKNSFPDVLNQRNIPRYAMAQTILGQMTDQFTADMVMRAADPDYYASRSGWDWASQLVLQVRRRDPEQWAYYYIRDKATQWKQAKTGVSREQGSYDSPDAEALRNFRRAIYAGDVDASRRLYLRLLDYGYTAQRFEAGIKASEPLAELSTKDGSRRAFVDGLSPYERKMLDKAQVYELRMSSLKLDARRIFPMEIKGYPAATRKMVERFKDQPRNEVLEQELSKPR